MRRTLILLIAVVVALVLFGPVQFEHRRDPPTPERTPEVVDDDADARARSARLLHRGCFGLLLRGTPRPRPGCERIVERRGGVETRLGTVEIPER